MHHRDDEHIVRFDGVENSKRKNSHQASSHICLENSPTSGGVAGSADRGLHAIDESQLQPCLANCIVSRGFFILFKRFGVELEPHSVSPPKGASYPRKRFIAWNGLNTPAANIFDATLCLNSP